MTVIPTIGTTLQAIPTIMTRSDAFPTNAVTDCWDSELVCNASTAPA